MVLTLSVPCLIAIKYVISHVPLSPPSEVSYMVVAPSIVFYVLENGGTKEQYGIILSAFSFASFLAKPFVGYWADEHGFRFPYMVTLGLSSIGGFVYLIAGAWYGKTAIALMLTARLLGGIGAASAALGFAYLAKVVPHEEQTKVNSILSMTRIFGMATGPGFNIFLALIDTTWFGFHINDLNSVGLVLICTNLMAMLFIYFLLDEPEQDHSEPHEDSTHNESNGPAAIFRGLLSLPILIPIFSIFTFNANFQL
jgi:ceroid-lipofuscinosis MFS transporter 7